MKAIRVHSYVTVKKSRLRLLNLSNNGGRELLLCRRQPEFVLAVAPNSARARHGLCLVTCRSDIADAQRNGFELDGRDLPPPSFRKRSAFRTVAAGGVQGSLASTPSVTGRTPPVYKLKF